MIHSVTILNLDGVVALCQYYDQSFPDEQLEWETTLVGILFAEDGGAVKESCMKGDVVRVVGSKYVYVRGHEGLILAITGSDEHDEIILRGVMDTVIRVVDEACDRKFNEAQIVKFHGKVCVCLQEVFYEGTVLHTDIERIMQMSKLKPVKLKT